MEETRKCVPTLKSDEGTLTYVWTGHPYKLPLFFVSVSDVYYAVVSHIKAGKKFQISESIIVTLPHVISPLFWT